MEYLILFYLLFFIIGAAFTLNHIFYKNFGIGFKLDLNRKKQNVVIPQKSIITIPGDWENVLLCDYLKFYKIENPSKNEVINILGKVSNEFLKSQSDKEIDEMYHALYYTVKTKPHSEKLNKKNNNVLWVAYSIPDIYKPHFKLEYNSFCYFYLSDLNSSYCGDEKLLNIYKEQLLGKNLDNLPYLIAKIVKENGYIYKEEDMNSRAHFFYNYIPVTKAMAVYKHFTGVDYNKLFDNNNFDSKLKKDRERKIPQSVKDSVWNRAGGKCEECGSQINLEFDHIIPFSKGGSNTYRNIQLLCEKCNRSKSAKIG